MSTQLPFGPAPYAAMNKKAVKLRLGLYIHPFMPPLERARLMSALYRKCSELAADESKSDMLHMAEQLAFEVLQADSSGCFFTYQVPDTYA